MATLARPTRRRTHGGQLSRDGSCVVFTAARRSVLVPEDTNLVRDVYVRLRPAP
jgi:hypothetical protein